MGSRVGSHGGMTSGVHKETEQNIQEQVHPTPEVSNRVSREVDRKRTPGSNMPNVYTNSETVT